MAKRLTLHLQQNTTLSRVQEILEFCDRALSLYDNCAELSIDGSSSDNLERLARNCGLSLSVLQKNVFPFLRNLDILRPGGQIHLTDVGRELSQIQLYNPELLGDFLHLVLYDLYQNNPQRRYSWSYGHVVRQLWHRKEVILSSTVKKSLVSDTIRSAAQKFSLPEADIAFSESSISGILNWLRSLDPSVISGAQKDEVFQRRYFCSAPITVAAIGQLYQTLDRPLGSKIFIRQEIRDTLCQRLILEPQGLDSTLENAKRTYDYDRGGIFDFGYEGGYGQWLMLAQLPNWTQLL